MRQLWEDALATIRSKVTGENFATYFQPLRFASITDEVVHLVVDDPFFGDWVRLHYQPILDKAITQASGRSMRVVITVADVKSKVPITPSRPEQAIPIPRSIPVLPRATIEAPDWPVFPLNPHYRFSSYVVGPNNEMAHAASAAVGRNPAKAFNPLFIYGGTGLGKTHLLHAIAHRILEGNPSARIAYVSAEEFTNQVIKSIHGGEMDSFRRRYRTLCDVLLMDDAHVLAGKDRTQEEFFYTFNALHAAGKQIVLTSDKTPQDIPHLEDRLRSRFNWGLITDIKAPQFETRVAILQKKAARDGIELPIDVAFYLAKLICRNVRELEGALTRLSAYASFNSRTLSIDFAREVLDAVIDQSSRAVSIDSILKLVAEHFDVKVSDLRGIRRHKIVAHPRGIAMYLCRKHTQSSYPQIGKSFGGKDHSTVLAAFRKIERALPQNNALRNEVEALERKLSV